MGIGDKIKKLRQEVRDTPARLPSGKWMSGSTSDIRKAIKEELKKQNNK